eukprot:TRINITY_DN2028_c4_g1_i1.p1 TRINITY_DN2028_c4_g1~~TRINITY_DN2028_c4_g1_i1.p1  ORF type:complete len:1651 (+),score=569.89 TRINITY_DN2028_c4_g1_i1:144-4955(+)
MCDEKFVCVRDTEGGAVVVVDVGMGGSMKQPAVAEGAVMGVDGKVLALHSGKTVQVFDLAEKEKVGACDVPGTIQYVTWIKGDLLAIVTATHVYHWNPTTTSPKKQFEKAKELKDSQVLSYTTDATGAWLMLAVVVAKDGGKEIKGVLQLYSVEKKAAKIIDGHAGCFTEYKVNKEKCNIMVVGGQGQDGGRLFTVEMPTGKKQTASYEKKVASLPVGAPDDFPIAIAVQNGLIYALTRYGIFSLHDVETVTLIHEENTGGRYILGTAHSTNGLLGVTIEGAVHHITADVSSIVFKLKATNPSFALEVAGRAGIPEAEEMYQHYFQSLTSKGDVSAAIDLALTAPRDCLRTLETVKQLQGFPQIPGQSSSLMVYFNRIIEEDKLNKVEALELAKLVLMKQGGAEYLADLSKKKKIEASEELADKLQPLDPDLALTFYSQAKCHTKAIQLHIHRQQFSKALEYIRSNDGAWQPDLVDILTKLVATNADGAAEFALLLHKEYKGKSITPSEIVDLFLDRTCVKQATGYLLAILTTDDEKDMELQTRLFEMNLLHSSAQVVEALFTQGRFTKFDGKKIASLCEKAGLYLRALKLNCKVHLKEGNNLQAIQRCGVNASQSAPQWLPEILKILSPEDCMGLVKALVSASPRLNAPVCAEAVIPQLHRLPNDAVIDMFAEHKAYTPLYNVLTKLLPTSEDERIHTKYVECALRTGQTTEIEAITRTSDFYNPQVVLSLLNEVRLSDPWPYINVCNKHKLWDSMIGYLMGTRNLRYLDLYVTEREPQHLPFVVGALLDAGADDEYITTLIYKVASPPVGQVIQAVEARGKITMLLPWMEHMIQQGCDDKTLVTTLAKQYIDNARQNAREYLEEHKGQYDSLEVGKYAEGRSAELAFAAYETGSHDDQVIRLAVDNKMYGELAQYCLKRQDLPLWKSVLSRDDRKELVSALVSTAIPKVSDPTEISVAVKAFTQAGMPTQLTAILEKLILDDEGSAFSQNRYLQNLLLLTVIQTEPAKAMSYIKRLDKYDVAEMAAIALKKGLNEETLEMYRRSPGGECDAMRVLIETIGDIDRAKELAERTDGKACWGILGKVQLQRKGMLTEALMSLTKAADCQQTMDAVRAVKESGKVAHYKELVTYLETVRGAATDGDMSYLAFADTELAYSLARCEMFTKLSQFLAESNLANLTQAGDRCYDEGLYEAARVLYTAEHNHAKLASTLIHLKQYLEALDAAQKAGSIKTWKEVCYACVNADELRLAQMAAQHIIVAPEELDGLCHYFEAAGKVAELEALLKTGLSNERTHIGMYTQLGLLLTRHNGGKVLEYLKLYAGKMNRTEMLRSCEAHHLWTEVRYLHVYNEDWDSALSVMLDHPSPAWEHNVFKETCCKATVIDHIYSGVSFYLASHPDLLGDFLYAVSNRVNPERVVLTVHRLGSVALVKDWLVSVQKVNNKIVNEAVNQLLIEEEDYESLRESLQNFTNFDRHGLCSVLASHSLMEMRRVASWLHAQSGKHQQAIDTALADRLYQDATEYAAESKDPTVVNSLLTSFMEKGLHECFAAALYTCYEIAEPDVAVELAWRHKNADIVMPYFIQVLKELWDSRCQCGGGKCGRR